ncbi:D-alanyl-D-alanine carboxypeptidase DacC [Crenothrix polyspora]|uniref:serine-type D-Ala-D-Ala carboxypeptidase n=1 Tax=Crenothrix polyspora TaxID=360316 RepID=A0A1R4H7I9_9GAMM|nr:D-alanyl-D-alanine carboxypeptidase family protein [Crenothrix polyspora]SJM92127.1 D-alanyl-D-alanine carboxypeptidase DacC [Crenothrix polyspora]
MMPAKGFTHFHLFLACSLLSASSQILAEDAKIVPVPAAPVSLTEPGKFETPAPPTIAASSHILLDFHTGKILAENNADAKLAPASLTKIMTTYVVFKEIESGRLHLDDVATVSEKAWKTSGSKMFVQVNDRVKIEDLLQGVIIQSGNDASVTLAEHVAGDENTFAEMMNQNAARLGMVNTHFKNADGLPVEEHYTTARDLSILTRALIKEFPQHYKWFSQKEFTYNKITQQNRNLLLSRDGTVDGVKTGHTEEAGYCLVASALREEMRLISIVMGTKSQTARAVENQTLLNYGFRFFESHRLYEGNKALNEARIWKGQEKILPLGLAEDLYVTVPRRHYQDMKAVVNVDKKILAPVKVGDKFGSVDVTLKGEMLIKKDLIALKAVEKGSIFRRLIDSALQLMEKSDAK